MTENQLRTAPAEDELEINLLDLFLILWRGKWFILIVTILAMAGAVGYGFLEERVYEVTASFAVTRGSSIRVGMGNEDRLDISVLLSILRSEQLAREVVEELNLVERWEAESSSRAARSLRDQIKIDTNREQSVIDIRYQNVDPQLAKNVVDSYIENFVRINREVNVTETAQSLAFVEDRLQEVEGELALAVEELKSFQDRHRIFSLSDQSKALVDAYVKTEDRLREARMDYQIKQESLSSHHPEIRIKERNIEELERQLEALERGLLEDLDSDLIPFSGTSMGLQDIPRLTLELSRLNQEIDILRDTYQLLRSKQETLKIEASRESEIVRLIDPPRFPETPMGRGITLKGAIAGVLGVMVSVFLLFILDFLRKSELSPEILEEVPFLKWFIHTPRRLAK